MVYGHSLFMVYLSMLLYRHYLMAPMAYKACSLLHRGMTLFILLPELQGQGSFFPTFG
jgi:hypothetical protein